MSRPSRNPEPQAARVWFRFVRLQGRIRNAVSARLKEAGLSIPQCDVLTTLSEREGVSQQELAAHLYVTKGNISGLVDRLEAAGLVERRAIVGDKRSNALFLTARGRDIAALGVEIQERFVTEVFGGMRPDDLATLEASLIAVRDRVRDSEGTVVNNLSARRRSSC